MTKTFVYTPPLVIAPQALAVGVSRVTAVNRGPDIPASTSVTLGQQAANVLTYSPARSRPTRLASRRNPTPCPR